MAQILIFGDSITWGAWDSKHGGWAQILKQHIDKQIIDSDYTNYHEVYNLGISGENTDKLLKRVESEIKSRVETEQAIIIFAIGVNDSQVYHHNQDTRVPHDRFISNLNKMISIAQKHTNKTAFIGPTLVDEQVYNQQNDSAEKTYTNESIQRFNQTLKEIVERHVKK